MALPSSRRVGDPFDTTGLALKAAYVLAGEDARIEGLLILLRAIPMRRG